jgi:uncharacterized damage-inducible protein DinB
MMSIGESLLPEYDQEMQSTRTALERIPEKNWSWKPHEKSGSLGWLAGHIATVPEWITMTLRTGEFDYAPAGTPAYEPPKMENRAQLLATFDKAVAEARAAIASTSDADMMKEWKLLAGGKEIFSMPRIGCIRGMCLNHLYHHRGQLTVYYRLLGVPVPALYGPSADEGNPAPTA